MPVMREGFNLRLLSATPRQRYPTFIGNSTICLPCMCISQTDLTAD